MAKLNIVTAPPIIQPSRVSIILTAPRKGKAAESLTSRGEEFILAAFEAELAEDGVTLTEAATISIERVETEAGYQIVVHCDFIMDDTEEGTEDPDSE